MKKTHQINHPHVQRLNEILESKKLTKSDLARICEVNAQSVNNWFALGTIGESSAIKLADALGISLEWILGQEVDEKDGLKSDERRLLHSTVDYHTQWKNRTSFGFYPYA